VARALLPAVSTLVSRLLAARPQLFWLPAMLLCGADLQPATGFGPFPRNRDKSREQLENSRRAGGGLLRRKAPSLPLVARSAMRIDTSVLIALRALG